MSLTEYLFISVTILALINITLVGFFIWSCSRFKLLIEERDDYISTLQISAKQLSDVLIGLKVAIGVLRDGR